MNVDLVGAIARRAKAAATRRSALLALAVPALRAGLDHPASVAGKGGKGGKAGKKARKRCQRQRGQCLTFLETDLCAPGMVNQSAGTEAAPRIPAWSSTAPAAICSASVRPGKPSPACPGPCAFGPRGVATRQAGSRRGRQCCW